MKLLSLLLLCTSLTVSASPAIEVANKTPDALPFVIGFIYFCGLTMLFCYHKNDLVYAMKKKRK